jgi:hypothetical protein
LIAESIEAPLRSMRTRANINLDSDAYSFASEYARAKGIPLGAAVSELIRRAEQTAELPVSASSKLERDEHGFLVVKAGGSVITSKMVKEASEDGS